MHIGIYRWEGWIDPAMVNAIADLSGVRLAIIPVGEKVKYLCLADETKTYLALQPAVHAVMNACNAVGSLGWHIYLIGEGPKLLIELDVIQLLESENLALTMENSALKAERDALLEEIAQLKSALATSRSI